jgi:hypothetical protein
VTSRFDSLAAAMQAILMDQFAQDVAITPAGCATAVTVRAIFNVNRDAMPAGGESNPRPQPEAFLLPADVPANCIGGTLAVNGTTYRIVRIHDDKDGQMRVELGAS